MFTLKLMSPLKVYSYNDDDEEVVFENPLALEYSILGAIKKEEETADPIDLLRGLMAYYDDTFDAVGSSVLCARPTVEVVDGKLVGMCNCVVNKDFSDAARDLLIDYLTGQYSDGWGEGFEQQPIGEDPETGNLLYCSFWSNDPDWKITEYDPMADRLAEMERIKTLLDGLLK